MARRNEKKLGEIPIYEPFQLCWIWTGSTLRSSLRYLRSLVIEDFCGSSYLRPWAYPVIILSVALLVLFIVFFFSHRYTEACLLEKGDAAYIQSIKDTKDGDYWVYIMRDGSEYVGYHGHNIGDHICN